MFRLGVLMSRCKTSSSSTSSGTSAKTPATDSSAWISQTTATVLYKADVINFCNKLLQALLEYWRSAGSEDTTNTIGGNLLKEHLPHSPPDMTPFFLRQFVKGQPRNVT